MTRPTNSRDRDDSPSANNAETLSRRSFVKGGGTLAVGTGVAGSLSGAAKEAAAQERAVRAVGPDAVPLSLSINGTPREVRVEPRLTLNDVLRNELEMTGTKLVCNRGACSACTVTLDGDQVCSCMVLAVDADGSEVETIEGYADSFSLTDVQEAFVRNDAQQCGMCTPGMVQNATALLNSNPKPTLDEVKTALSGNLCRCGAYPKIFAAVMDASGQAPADDGSDVIVRRS